MARPKLLCHCEDMATDTTKGHVTLVHDTNTEGTNGIATSPEALAGLMEDIILAAQDAKNAIGGEGDETITNDAYLVLSNRIEEVLGKVNTKVSSINGVTPSTDHNVEIDLGVISINGLKGDVTGFVRSVNSVVPGDGGNVTLDISHPVTSVNGMTGDVTISTVGSLAYDSVFISGNKSATLPSGGTWKVVAQSTGDNKDHSFCGEYAGGSTVSVSNYGGGSFILGIRVA